jgi:hypothetical protein
VLWQEGHKKARYNISTAQGFAEYQKATGQDAHSLVAKVDAVGAEHGSIRLPQGSLVIDQAQPLTSTVTAGAGTKVSVKDVSCFSAGYKTRAGEVLVLGDTILVGEARARIDAIDRVTSHLVVDRSLQWEAGTPITYTYQGMGPDVGAFELE